MGISSWSWFKQHIDQKSLNWWERSSEYVRFTYMWITASNLISDNDVNSLFHNPILFPYLRNILSLGSLFNCCCQYFWSYFETHPGCVTSWPLDSGSSVIPTKTTVNLLSLQGLLSLSLFFSSGGKLISFLPGVSVVDLIYPCWETVMVLIKLRVSHWFGSAHCGEELLRDLLRDWWANKGSRVNSDTKTDTRSFFECVSSHEVQKNQFAYEFYLWIENDLQGKVQLLRNSEEDAALKINPN